MIAAIEVNSKMQLFSKHYRITFSLHILNFWQHPYFKEGVGGGSPKIPRLILTF